MVVKRNTRILLSGTLLGASFLLAAPVLADDAETAQLQKQINALQKQLQSLQSQVTQSKKQAEAAKQQATQPAPQSASALAAPAGVYNAVPPGSPMFTKAPAWLGSVQISLAGSFLALEGAVRQHNEVSDGASDPPYGGTGIPLQNSPLWHENEFRMSAQQSRIALKATGDIDPAQHLKGYYEMDFLGASTDANNRQSNSFTPRIRQLYGEYDNDNYHFHTAFGQTWSFVTQERVGLMPGFENIPLTIDAQYVTGFNWTRQPTVRLVGDWDKMVWFGLSIEQPQGVVAGSGASGVSASPPTSITTGPAGSEFITNVNNTCQGASHLDNTTTCTNDIAPDLVEKVAIDPGWGHYEVFGLQRWFADNVSPGTGALGTVNWSTQTTMGWGVGGSVLLPVVPKYLDLQASVLTGQGIGRYGDSQLPDVVVGPTGSLSAIQATHFLVGAVGHPFQGNDIYAYYGQEQNNADFWTVTGHQGGWGNPNYANNLCAIEGPAVAGATTYNAFQSLAAPGCSFNVQRVQEFTIGFWQDAYKGDLGRVRVGAQYEYVRLTSFAGAPGPTTATSEPNAGLNPNNNIVFFSLRYYPFN
jgi:hypothetical protein